MSHWNSFNTFEYSGMIAETVNFKSDSGKQVRAYWSRPLGDGPFPGIVLIHHMPGWDELNREYCRRFTEHGFSVVCPNLYEGFGDGTPPEVTARAREEGGMKDDDVMERVDASLSFLRNQVNANGKVGVIGMCSGGRHTFLAACTLDGIDAAVDCWGGGVVTPRVSPTGEVSVAPIEYVDNLSCPLMGNFGNDDHSPTKDEVDKLEEILKEKGKEYEFHRYDGAGHGFWGVDREGYRWEQAMDSWNATLDFFSKYLR